MRLRAAALVMLVLLFGGAAQAKPAPKVQVNLEGVSEEVEVVQTPDGSHRFRLESDGRTRDLTPEEFAARVYDEQGRRAWWLLVLNITSPLGVAWVVLGLTGQLLFTGRMVVQLFASEKSQRSVIPASFWWMSLTGATMLLVYFSWRVDIVGIIGQSIGWVIYVRNIFLVRKERLSVEGEP